MRASAARKRWRWCVDCRVHRLVADVAVIVGGRVLLVRYRDTARYDGQRGWFLPDDLLAHAEHPTDAARRILVEQVGVMADPFLARVESFGNGAWHLVFHHVARLDDEAELSPGPNTLAAEWFGLNALPQASEIAHHGWALDVLADLAIGS
jgi:ADP-ribose pyrophosphatase YjhB (NUDIX family)